jgi:heme/copper-type cytochrome/quinol oxidase subunit 2
MTWMALLGIWVLTYPATLMAQDHHHAHGHHRMGHDGDDHYHQREGLPGHGFNIAVCPRTGDGTEWEYRYEHQGETFHFCSKTVLSEFKKNPAEYKDRIESVDVEAFQFGFEPAIIVVDKGTIVRLHLRSRDVDHGFKIGAYNINVRVEKDHPKTVEFIADKAGEFDIVCSVYCGREHHAMEATFIVSND